MLTEETEPLETPDSQDSLVPKETQESVFRELPEKEAYLEKMDSLD